MRRPQSNRLKAILSIKGVLAICGLISLFFIAAAAVTFFTNRPNWQLWLIGSIPFGLVAGLILILQGINALAWYLAIKTENFKLPGIKRPAFRRQSRLSWVSFILKRLAAGLVILVAFVTFMGVLIEGGALLGAVFGGLQLGLMTLIAVAPLFIIAIVIDIADFIYQSIRTSQAQNERLIALLEKQQQRIEQLEQQRKPEID